MGVTFYTMFDSNCLTFFIRTGCPVQLQSNSIGHILSSQSFHINSHAWRQNIASHIYRYRYFTYYRCLATRTYLKNFSWRMVLELPEHILHTVPIGVHIARHPYLSSNYIGWYNNMYWYVIIFQLLNHPVSSHILPHVGYILKTYLTDLILIFDEQRQAWRFPVSRRNSLLKSNYMLQITLSRVSRLIRFFNHFNLLLISSFLQWHKPGAVFRRISSFVCLTGFCFWISPISPIFDLFFQSSDLRTRANVLILSNYKHIG